MEDKIILELSRREAEILAKYLVSVIPAKVDELILSMLYARIKSIIADDR